MCETVGGCGYDGIEIAPFTFASCVEEVSAESVAAIPAGRYGNPREYGQTVAFLASQAAAYINGSVIRVDGGYISSI